MLTSLTPSQALLLLHQKYADQPDQQRQLEKLYLLGPTTPALGNQMESLMRDAALTGVTINDSPLAIQRDPTRRYFETQLAFFTLQSWLPRLMLNHVAGLSMQLIAHLNVGGLQVFEKMMMHISRPYHPLLHQEFSAALDELKQIDALTHFSSQEKALMHYLLCTAYLGVVLASSTALPLNIYNKGLFHPSLRGLVPRLIDPALAASMGTTMTIPIENQQTSHSQAFGILTSVMPLPRHSNVWREHATLFVRAPDRNHYHPDSPFVTGFFDLKVHPFVNSISGTLLCQLRSFLFLIQSDELAIENTSNIHNYFRCFIATLLYLLGGHSLLEFCLVLNLPEVVAAFKPWVSFGEDGAALETLFYQDNTRALQQAVTATQVYQQHWLRRQQLHQELQQARPVSPST